MWIAIPILKCIIYQQFPKNLFCYGTQIRSKTDNLDHRPVNLKAEKLNIVLTDLTEFEVDFCATEMTLAQQPETLYPQP